MILKLKIIKNNQQLYFDRKSIEKTKNNHHLIPKYSKYKKNNISKLLPISTKE